MPRPQIGVNPITSHLALVGGCSTLAGGVAY